ncbi:hypothetical protein PENFLA_c025G01003 [Penicillium flavigenum]|uniref:Phosphoesterase n=1 Tax=Penicillium flavigenum TaxID=254877 RepID=A0A1V6ST18_9EURO|nr:hypothetical protein PENFLA_c025G01003 [Penicillium flavigenum]
MVLYWGFVVLTALASLASTRPTGSAQVWGQLRENIKHIIYLTLENHSFDNIAGYWDFHPDIDNLRNLTFCNDYTNPNWTVYGEPLAICAEPDATEVPLKDPDHNFGGATYEIFRQWNPEKDDVFYRAPIGEVQCYPWRFSIRDQGLEPEEDRYSGGFAEHPGPTNPNRQSATSGSSCGFVDNTYQSAGFWNNVTGTTCAVSIFESLSKKNISWKNYYETDIVDAFMYKWVQDNAMDRLVHATELYHDLEAGALPSFSYLNPECCTVDSMHPTSSMAAGEQMVKHLYDALRRSKYWDNAVLIINFDEHGGFADHVPTPLNVPQPEDGIIFKGKSSNHNFTYNFTRLGVRVPAFIISPWVLPNLLIHDQGTMYADDSAYTHSSILHFLQELWGLEGLNNRVQWAKTFEMAFTNKRRDDTPMTLVKPTWYGGSGQPEPEPFFLLNQDESYYARRKAEAKA